MNDLEKFLRQATRGLWGKEKNTVRKELESHVRQRATRYELAGSSDQDAIKLAIEDLGEARAISAGMSNVYSIPNMIRTSVFAVLLCGFALLGLRLGAPQVNTTTKFLTPECIEQKKASFTLNGGGVPCESGILSIEVASLKKVLEPLGVRFEAARNGVVLHWPEKAVSAMSTTGPVVQFSVTKDDKLVPVVAIKGYMMAETFFEALKESGLPVLLRGWDNPEINVGKTKFLLGSGARSKIGSSIYPGVLQRRLDLMFSYGNNATVWTFAADWEGFKDPKLSWFTHKIFTKLKPGTVAVVVSRDPEIKLNAQAYSPRNTRAFVAPVSSDGSIDYPSFSRSIALVNPQDLQVGVQGAQATVTVLRFNGEYSNSPEMLKPVPTGGLEVRSR